MSGSTRADSRPNSNELIVFLRAPGCVVSPLILLWAELGGDGTFRKEKVADEHKW